MEEKNNNHTTQDMLDYALDALIEWEGTRQCVVNLLVYGFTRADLESVGFEWLTQSDWEEVMEEAREHGH